MSMPTASQNCLATSPQAGPFLSLLVAPRSKAPRLSTFSPNPPKISAKSMDGGQYFQLKSSRFSNPAVKIEEH